MLSCLYLPKVECDLTLLLRVEIYSLLLLCKAGLLQLPLWNQSKFCFRVLSWAELHRILNSILNHLRSEGCFLIRISQIKGSYKLIKLRKTKPSPLHKSLVWIMKWTVVVHFVLLKDAVVIMQFIEGEGKWFFCYQEQILVLDLIRIWFSICCFNIVIVTQMSSLFIVKI